MVTITRAGHGDARRAGTRGGGARRGAVPRANGAGRVRREGQCAPAESHRACLLYTSDAADDM
eukprot:956841-Prymnesium_polylepis.2